MIDLTNIESFGVPAQAIEQAAGAFRHIDDISSKPLRKILSKAGG